MPNGPVFSDEPVGEPVARCARTGGGSGGKWDVDCVLKILCPKDQKIVDQLAKTTVDTADEIWWDDEYYDGTKWTIKKFPGGGSANSAKKQIMVLSDTTCEGAADTFYHEIWHQNQPPGMGWPEPAEDDAYYNTELWLIERGLPGGHNLRTTDATGKVIPDKAKIRKLVQEEYPSPPPPSGGKPSPVPITADWANKKTEVQDPSTGKTSWRASKKGDMIPGPQHFKNKKTIAKSKWKCPPPAPPPPPPAPPPKKGCFIATAAYGSPSAPDVQFLRSLRDDVLRKSVWGRTFFEGYWDHYYRLSPPIAAEMERDPELRELVRWSLVTPLVNYYKLLVNRPRNWHGVEGLEPEMVSFLELLRSSMEEWLRHVPIPTSFEGRTAEEAAMEVALVLDLVLRTPQARAGYLRQLQERGTLPLCCTAEQRGELESLLRSSHCTEEEICAVLGDGEQRKV
jgi:hypothetical protein